MKVGTGDLRANGEWDQRRIVDNQTVTSENDSMNLLNCFRKWIALQLSVIDERYTSSTSIHPIAIQIAYADQEEREWWKKSRIETWW